MIGLRACRIAWFASHEKTWEFSLGSNINEILFLHGTNCTNVGSIAVQGFDDRLAGHGLHAPSIVEQALALPLDVIRGMGHKLPAEH